MVLEDVATDDGRLQALAELLYDMLHSDPEERPDMCQVCHRMTVCLAALRS